MNSCAGSPVSNRRRTWTHLDTCLSSSASLPTWTEAWVKQCNKIVSDQNHTSFDHTNPSILIPRDYLIWRAVSFAQSSCQLLARTETGSLANRQALSPATPFSPSGMIRIHAPSIFLLPSSVFCSSVRDPTLPNWTQHYK